MICADGTPWVEPTTEEGKEAYAHFLELYNGNVAKAAEAYVMHEGDEHFRKNTGALSSFLIPGFSPHDQRQISKALLHIASTLFWRAKEAGESVSANKILNDTIAYFALPAATNEDGSWKYSKEEIEKRRGKGVRITEFFRKQAKLIVEQWDPTDPTGKPIGNGFLDVLIADLRTVGISLKGNRAETIEGEDENTVLEDDDAVQERTRFEDDARFSQDSKKTASAAIKVLIAQIPDMEIVNGKTQAKKNYLGLPVYVDFETAYEETVRLLANRPPTLSGYIAALEEKASQRPFMGALAKKLKSPTTKGDLKRKFVTAFGKHYYEFLMNLVMPTYAKDGKSITRWQLLMINSNREKQGDMLLRNWYENAKITKITTRKKTGEIVVNKEYVEKLKNNLRKGIKAAGEDLKSESFLTGLQKILSEMGMIVDVSTLAKLAEETPRLLSTSWAIAVNPDSTKGFIRYLFDGFETGSEETDYATANPYNTAAPRKTLKKVALFVADNSDRLYTESHRNIEKNLVNSFQNMNHLTMRVEELRNADPEVLFKILNNSFGQDSLIAKTILENPELGKEFKVEFFDGQRHNKGIGYKRGKLGTAAQTVFHISTFQSGRIKGGASVVGPTRSDKTSTEMLSFLPIQDMIRTVEDTPMDIFIEYDEDAIVGLDGAARIGLMSVARSEMRRIFSYQHSVKRELQEAGITLGGYTSPMGPDGRHGAEYFYLMPFLNPEAMREFVELGVITQAEYNAVWNGGNLRYIPNHVDGDIVEDIVWKIIERVFIDKIAAELADWRKMGIYLKSEDGTLIKSRSLLDGKYMDEVAQGENDSQKLVYAAADYLINSVVLGAENYRLISGDIAFYAKSPKQNKTEDRIIRETYKNTQKRLARDIAPFLAADWSDHPTVRTVTANDPLVKSVNSAMYEYLLSTPAYNEYNTSTDAQELTTLTEHARILEHYGRITMDAFKKVEQAAREAKEDANNPTNYFDLNDLGLSQDDLIHLRHPLKPVRGGEEFMPEYDLSAPIYRKSSSFPLVPTMTANFDIDNLRVAMENANVDSLGFKSADKVTAVSPINITGEDGKFLSTDEIYTQMVETPAIRTVVRRGGLQQELADKAMEVPTLTQMNTHLFNGIDEITDLSFDGKTYNALALRTIKERIRKAQFETGVKSLLTKLGSEDDVLDIKIQKLHDILMEEAIKNNWSRQDLQQLSLVTEGVTEDDKGIIQFRVPLQFSAPYQNVESLILSLVKKHITHQRMYGRSYAQGSSFGFRGSGKNSQIVFAPDYDPEIGLQSARVAFIDKSGKEHAWTKELEENTPAGYKRVVLPAQIMVPFFFHEEGDSGRTPLNLEDFTIVKDGRKVIDTNKLPKEILKGIGGRIPGQGHSSMLPFEIVGFIPESMGRLALVPGEITIQMGSDFDIDMLYTYLTPYDYVGGKMVEFKPDVVNKKGGVDEALIQEQYDKYKDELEAKRSKFFSLRGKALAQMAEEGKDTRDPAIRAEVGNIILEQLGMRLQDTRSPMSFTKYKARALKAAYYRVHQSVLSHPEVFKKLMAPLDIKDLAKESERIEAKRTRGRVEPTLFPSKQIADHISQGAGKELVGVFTNAAQINVALLGKKVGLSRASRSDGGYLEQGRKKESEKKHGVPIKVGSKVVWLDSLSTDGRSTYEGESRTKADVFMMAQSASVDNANENVIGPLNISQVTSNAYNAMAELSSSGSKPVSIGTKFIATFLTQEAVFLYKEIRENLTKPSTEVREKTGEDLDTKALRITREFLINKYKQVTGKDDAPTVYWGKDIALSEDLLDAMLDATTEQKGGTYWHNQMKVLELFKEFTNIGKTIRKLGSGATRFIRKGPGTSLPTFIIMRDDLRAVMEEKLHPLTEVSSVMSDELLSAAMTTEQFVTNAIMPYFIYDTDTFTYIGRQLAKIIKKNENTLFNEEETRTLVKAIRSYIYSHKSLWPFNPLQRRAELMFGTPDLPPLAERVAQLKLTDWGSGDYLLSRLSPRVAEKKGHPNLVEFLASKGEPTDAHRIEESLTALLLNPDEDIAAIGEDIVQYAYLTGGNITPVSIVKHIPVFYLERIGMFKALRAFHRDGVFEDGSGFNAGRFMDSFLKHNPHLAPEIPKVDIRKFTKKDDEGTYFEPEITEDEPYGPALVRDANGDPEYANYMHYSFTAKRKFLFVRDVKIEDRLVYRPVETLGDINIDDIVAGSASEWGQANSMYPVNFKYGTTQASLEDVEKEQLSLFPVTGLPDPVQWTVHKIISGGQTGADRGGLEVAKSLGIETGGDAPQGFLTEAGPDRTLADFGLTELTDQTGSNADKYRERTQRNVQNSDGTILFGNDKSPGSIVTRKAVDAAGKPYMNVPYTPSLSDSELYLLANSIRKWAKDNNIRTLNVAGNRASVAPDIQAFTERVLGAAFGNQTDEEEEGGTPAPPTPTPDDLLPTGTAQPGPIVDADSVEDSINPDNHISDGDTADPVTLSSLLGFTPQIGPQENPKGMSLGGTVADAMKQLTPEERKTYRDLRDEGRSETTCE